MNDNSTNQSNGPLPPPPLPPQPPRSHVTNAPSSSDGENYDPQIRTQYANEPKVIHAARQEPAQFSVSEENNKRHERSKQKYPFLNLSAGEFVVLDVKRHPIGLLIPVFATGIVLLAMLVVMIIYPGESSAGSLASSLPPFSDIVIPLLLFMLLVGVGGAIAVWVYLQNQFFLTNESVIQEIQHSLFSRHEQTVSLGSIEDASFKQSGILQHLFNYGTVRLSTEGEETTYRFAFVANPRNHVAILNNAVEAFKNGRPVESHED